jgi:LCP family protein required for cell wall assembly
MKVFWGVLYGLILLLCLTLGAAGRLTLNTVESIGGGKANVVQVIQGLANPRAQFPNDSELTLLLVGQDYNRDRKGMPYTKASRADTIMMMAVNLDDKTVRACSIPRDTYVEAPDGRSGKINGTFARGGIDLLKHTLQAQFGVSIDYHIIVKPDAVRKIVDSVGGVEVETIDAMKYDDNWGGLHVDLPKGKQWLDGTQAEGFVRFREVNRMRMNSRGYMVPIRNVKGSLEEGDLRRTARQQQLIQSLMASANSASNLLRVDEIIDTGFNQIETNLERTQILALAQIFRGSSSNLQSGTVPGEDRIEGGAYYFVLDRERAQAMVDWLILGDESGLKRLVRIEVRNGTGAKGLARKFADQLVGEGYQATAPGNAPETPKTTVIYRKAMVEATARRIAETLGIEEISKNSSASEYGPEIEVVLGQDSLLKLGSTTTSNSG